MSAEHEPSALNALLRAERAGDEGAADSALERVLELAASAAGPEPLVRAQVEHALREALGAGVTGAVAGTRASWLRSGWARAGSKLGLVTVGVAIGFVWGRSPEWRAERASEPASASGPAVVASPEPPPAVDSARGATPVARPDHAVASPAIDVSVAALDTREATASGSAPSRAHAQPPRATRPRATRALASDAQSNDTLRIALEQLRKAQLFLSASEPARALAALDELDARVPAAILSEERDVTRALALCKTGDSARAAALAARVLARAPDSAYALSLRESCAGQELLVEQMRERTSNRAQ